MVTKKALELLARLNRSSLKHVFEINDVKSAVSKISEPESSVHEPSLRIHGGKVEYVSLEDAVPGQTAKSDGGEFLLIKRRLKDIRTDARELVTMFSTRLKRLHTKDADVTNVSAFEALKSVHPSKILFLDIETCGLADSPLFLIGIAYFTGEDFSFLQLFARDYHEEKPLLSFFNSLLSQYSLLVTFNGKSFDLPFVLSRGHANRVRISDETPHLDLLFEVRRLLRHRLPDCKLQTVERYVFNRKRTGDIPGREIPQVYREFVQTGNASQVKRILEHNMHDIITMIDIVIHLSGNFKDIRNF